MRITDEQKERAAFVNLPQFLMTHGFDLKKVGREYVWKDHDSLHIKDNGPGERGAWFRFSEDKGGDNIGFLREYMGMSFVDAVEALTGEHIDRTYTPSRTYEQKPKTVTARELSLAEADNARRVFAYLCKTRGLDYDLVASLVRQGVIAQEEKTGNVLFKYYDEQGKVIGAEKVGTSTEHKFKGIATGSAAGHGFEVVRGSGEKAFFFESAIDMLSYLQMHDKELTDCRLVSMMGVKPNIVLDTMLRHNISPENVSLCSDNDTAGNEFAQRLQEQYPDMKRVITPDTYKDWNDMLRGIPKAVEHETDKKEVQQTDMQRYGNEMWHKATDNRDKSLVTIQAADFARLQEQLDRSGINYYAYARDNSVIKDRLEDTIVSFINAECTKKRGSLLEVLRHGVELSGHKLELMFTKPATTFNKDLMRKYEMNRFTVMEEAWANDKERIDVVIFLNGFAIISMELKCNYAGQSTDDAIYQYRMERDPKSRLFLFKAGTLVNFAMDLHEVYMTTKLDGEKTFFLPFNQGNGEGVNAGAGNAPCEDDYPVHYMWDDILTKDTILDLISKFIFIQTSEKENEKTGKVEVKESIIFPRYHQLDAVRKLLADVEENRTFLNYLIQHSAGSGKTNTIAWLAYRLATLHDADNKIIFDNVIIMTDRVVVDRQLQKAIMGMEHKSGLIRVMDEKCNSADLAIALNGNTKIIATTIQKFPYIVDSVQGLKNKRFAVIIDEAHSSTAGKDMAAVTQSLGMGDELYQDMEDEIAAELARNGKQQNVSMFAFTATPKPTTLQLFGTINPNGQREAFHVYSMKQAIEEGFILDVLQNYTTYKTFYQINKEIEEDPKMQTASAKRQIARFVELHETNIAQRIEVIVEHFRTTVMQELGGQAKAMVITASRQAAVKYCQAFEDYCSKKGYKGIRALVAFSGKVKLPDDDTEYTEPGINGIPEDQLTKEFDKDDYQVLLVANKYQTGFDQPKLCAMYIMKKLKGVNAVQTLSRLNRICPPFEKKTFILDFVNSYEDIVGAFAPYYTTTLLSNSVTPTAIYDLEAQIDAYAIIDPDDVDKVNEILYKEKVQSADKKKINFCLDKSQKLIEHYSIEKQREIVVDLRHFVRFYEFMIQVSSFEDTELHKKYNYIILLQSHINIKHPGPGFNLDGKIRATQFVQKKQDEHTESDIVAKPVVKLPSAESFGLTPAKEERLSEIIAAINARTGKSYDSDVAVKAMLQIRDILMKSDKLKASAKNNTVKDFEFSYFDDIDDALIEGLEQNQDFFSLLLNDEEIKREVLGIFTEEIYTSLKQAAEE